MGRYRGIGMPRAKKKKVEEVEEVQEDQGDEPPSPDPPPPPSPPRKPSRAVAPESPSKSVLLRAQQKSRATIRKKFKEAKAIQVAAYRDLDVAKRRFSRQVDDIHRDENRKLPLKKPSPTWHLQKAHRVELRWAEAQTKFYKAMWEAACAFACVDAAEVDVRDAKIARLQRQLKVARGRKKLRRGWSTTRVRFML